MLSHEKTLEVEQLYREYKPLLASIGYRMLGSMTEAEDAVQDVFVAVSKLGQVDIQHPKAYLVKLMTNRLLNMLKAAPRKREAYPGSWLPEPLIELGPAQETWEPGEHVVRREQLGYALLVLLQACTPTERAVFVLRESIGYDYADIAAILDKSEAACRKIYSRAISKLAQRPHATSEAALHRSMDRFVQSFSEAVETGRFDSFIRLLTEDAVLISDGGGKVRSALHPIKGRERIAAFFQGISGKGSLRGDLRIVSVSGQRGLLLVRHDQPPLVFALHPEEQGTAIASLYVVANPDKLTRLQLG
ncbi:sigma-70 family RNA polymerase sigma factor [Paenibacillus sp. YYML68]|uniref:sigma-70 family RNA polymerase sigma factor n=1 Tax=Paenibacillus sp. YYML68 TaxID=2909250 RepID=UPI0024913461|nr:sigma-70 family RNA polymerase sigma factor [Paenibacillus sp. YYML68]